MRPNWANMVNLLLNGRSKHKGHVMKKTEIEIAGAFLDAIEKMDCSPCLNCTDFGINERAKASAAKRTLEAIKQVEGRRCPLCNKASNYVATCTAFGVRLMCESCQRVITPSAFAPIVSDLGGHAAMQYLQLTKRFTFYDRAALTLETVKEIKVRHSKKVKQQPI